MSFWDKFLELQEKPVSQWVEKGYNTQELEAQRVFAKPEYTVISETEETVFVQDENGAPHVFTREEWAKMQGTGGAGLLAVVAIAAAALFLI